LDQPTPDVTPIIKPGHTPQVPRRRKAHHEAEVVELGRHEHCQLVVYFGIFVD
jgi:hypothetical protein